MNDKTWRYIRAAITLAGLVCLALFMLMLTVSKEQVVLEVSTAKFIIFGVLFVFLLEAIRFTRQFFYDVRYKWLMIIVSIIVSGWLIVTFIWPTS
jgi:hypothetical protein